MGGNINLNANTISNGAVIASSLQVTGGSPTNTALLVPTNSLGQLGYVVYPYFLADNLGGKQMITNGIFPFQIFFTNAVWNVGGYYSTSTSKFTPPAGKYRLHFSVAVLAGGNVITRFVAAIVKDGTVFKSGPEVHAAASGYAAADGILRGSGLVYQVDTTLKNLS